MRGRFRTTKRLLFHGSVRFLQIVATVLPRRVSLSVFATIGSIVRRVDRPAVRRSRTHLEKALGPGISAASRERIVRDIFRALGRNLVDLLAPASSSVPFQADGLEHLARPLREGRGVIVLSAHLGNWEVLGSALVARGFPLHVLAARLFDARSDRMLNAWRTARGVRVHHRDEGLAPLVAVLRAGGVVGTLADQDVPGRGIFADFFGWPAKTSVVPFALARRTGAALVPVLIHIGEDGCHRVRAWPEIAPDPTRKGPDRVHDLVRRWHEILETAICAHPEQWVWYHRRWKSSPPRGADLRKLSKQSAYVLSFQPSRRRAFAR